MFEKIDACPICNSKVFINHLICQDHLLTDESFTIVRCTSCSFLFTNPRPDLKNIGKYYQSDNYISHSDKSNSLTNILYKIARSFTLSQKVKLINSLTSYKTIFDYGCGTGHFLRACQKNGWEITGLEPDVYARDQAIDLTKTSIVSHLRQIDPSLKFSVITLWHVLEHIHEINETLELIQSLLTKNGRILIALPNHTSYDASHYKEYWAAYDVPRHLYHFSQRTMQLFLTKHALKIYKIVPMKLDSFYVSMLSEKYKYKRTNYIKSFINAYKSNVYAKKANNYSSLIYIAGK